MAKSKKGKVTYDLLKWDLIFSYFSNTIAIPLVKPIARTNITANQVSLFSIGLALLSAVLITFSNYKYSIIACVILQVVLILDCIDGMLARYKGQTSFYGLYMEAMFHEIVPTSLFLALGINSYKYFNNALPLFLGGITILFIFFINISRTNKERIVLYHIQKSNKIVGYAPHKLSRIKNKSFFVKFTDFIIQLFNSPGNFFTILLLLAILDKMHYAIFFYSLFYFVVAMGKVYLELTQGFKPYGLK